MHNPSIYHGNNTIHIRDAFYYIEKYINFFNFRSTDKVIDIGCGNGDVTTILTKYVDCNVTGVDISHKMVNYANECHQNEKLHFHVLNIEAKELPQKFCGEFHHIVSFWCLHWINDQRQAYENIWKLLKPGGDAFLLICSNNITFQLYDQLAEYPKWKEYLQDYQNFTPHDLMWNTREYVHKMLETNNLTLKMVSTESRMFSYTESQLRTQLEAVNPFIHRIPEECRIEFMDDVMEVAYTKKYEPEASLKRNGLRYEMTYEMLLVIFTK